MSFEEEKSKLEGVSEDRAFITSLVDPTDAKQNVHKVALNVLKTCVDNIGPQFKNVLNNHEEDFMAAYRVSYFSFIYSFSQGHMTKVKKELEFLKGKAEKAAGELSNDNTVTQLQSSIQWFQGEAIVLNTILEGQKREVQKLKSTKANTNDDNKFLKN